LCSITCSVVRVVVVVMGLLLNVDLCWFWFSSLEVCLFRVMMVLIGILLPSFFVRVIMFGMMLCWVCVN